MSSKGLESRAAGQPAFVVPAMAWGDIVYLIMEITKEFGSLSGVFLGQQICLQIPFLENNPGGAMTASLTALTDNVRNTGDFTAGLGCTQGYIYKSLYISHGQVLL